LRSMTGYGNSKWQSKDFGVEVSLRSVNGRFLETRFHLPKEYLFLESELRNRLTQKLARGTVDIYIIRQIKSGSHTQSVKVNSHLAKQIWSSYAQFLKEIRTSESHDPSWIFQNSHVLKIDESASVTEAEKKSVLKCFDVALQSCLKERSREGQGLKKHMLELLKKLEKEIQKISVLRDKANTLMQEKYEAKIKTRLKGKEIDNNRLAQEIVIQLEKADINEELFRLSEHFRKYKELLVSPIVEGKKLDFYTQELLREVNTIGSKSQLSEITQAVVEAKTLVEKLREQVQNIE